MEGVIVCAWRRRNPTSQWTEQPEQSLRDVCLEDGTLCLGGWSNTTLSEDGESWRRCLWLGVGAGACAGVCAGVCAGPLAGLCAGVDAVVGAGVGVGAGHIRGRVTDGFVQFTLVVKGSARRNLRWIPSHFARAQPIFYSTDQITSSSPSDLPQEHLVDLC